MKGLTLLVAGMLADMGKLDPDDSRPPYRQIADTLRAAIESGDLAPGAQLPALPALMDEYAVSLGTVRNALAALRDAGLIVTRQGKGSYVRTQRAPDAEDELTNLRRVVEALTVRLDDVERRLAEMAG
jgi:DNA-binding GntR family transcriptional regulator